MGPSALVVIGAALVAGVVLATRSSTGEVMPTQETDRRGIGAAVKNVAGHAGAWFRLEKELAALELKKKTVAVGLGIGLGIGAALVALYAIGFPVRDGCGCPRHVHGYVAGPAHGHTVPVARDRDPRRRPSTASSTARR